MVNCLGAAAVFITAAARLHALTIDNYTAAANDRFANDPAFIAGAFNLSGVSRASNGAWVTMIAPNVFVAANHYTPEEGNTVIFYATNNSSGPSVTRTVSGARQRIGTTDIFLGTLDRPLPEGYATYSRPTEVVTDSAGWTNTYRSAVLYHFGLSPGSYSGALDIGVGRNVPDRWAGQHTISPSTTWAFATTYDTSVAPNYQTHETQVVSGDSGAPIFFDAGNGTFRLLGLTWGNGTWSANGTNYPISIFTYLGNYQTEIANFLSTYSTPYLPNTPASFVGNRISSTRIDLSWTDLSSVETAYELQRSPDGSAWSSLATLAPNTTSYSDTTAPETDVHYRLRAVNGTTTGDWVSTSLTAPVPPGAPANFAVASVTTTSVQLSWSAVTGATTLRLERSTLGIYGPWSLVTDALPGNATSYSDNDLTAGTSYWYRLRASNTYGTGPWSKVLSTATANTQTLVNDPFTDGGVTNGADPLDVAWKKEGTAQIVTTDSALDPASPHNVMEISTTSTEGDVYAYFTLPGGNQTLAVGESLRLSFKLRHTGTPRTDNARTGFSIAYTPVNNPWTATGNREYTVRTSFGSTGNATYIARTADVQMVNSSGTDVQLINNQPALNAGTNAISAWMEVERTGNSTVVLRTQLGSNPVIQTTDTGVANGNGTNSGIITTFNRVFFRFRTVAGGTDPQFRLDDVIVTKTALGTPAQSQHPITAWRNTYWSTTANTGNAADTADPDGDGLPNLLEYALGSNPTSASSSARPEVGTTTVSGQQRLTLSFTPQNTAGLQFIIQASTDLTNWTNQTDVTSSLTEGQSYTFIDTADLANTPRRFLRLRVVVSE